MREQLITTILELSNDEFETKKSIIELAKESEEELITRVMDIAYYYKQELDEL
jgi:hypothetical protein